MQRCHKNLMMVAVLAEVNKPPSLALLLPQLYIDYKLFRAYHANQASGTMLTILRCGIEGQESIMKMNTTITTTNLSSTQSCRPPKRCDIIPGNIKVDKPTHLRLDIRCAELVQGLFSCAM
jgi:hypothetical protein